MGDGSDKKILSYQIVSSQRECRLRTPELWNSRSRKIDIPRVCSTSITMSAVQNRHVSLTSDIMRRGVVVCPLVLDVMHGIFFCGRTVQELRKCDILVAEGQGLTLFSAVCCFPLSFLFFFFFFFFRLGQAPSEVNQLPRLPREYLLAYDGHGFGVSGFIAWMLLLPRGLEIQIEILYVYGAGSRNYEARLKCSAIQEFKSHLQLGEKAMSC